jgi:8-oxo-dGTP pyrophosphatase MutT (NUDIX family)
MTQRAVRPGDPWSGDIALPGGMASPQDLSAHEVAEREAREEVGLSLSPPIGRLHEHLAFEPRSLRPMPLTPLVYAVGPGAEARPDGREVVAIRWVPWQVLTDPARRCKRRRRIGPLPMAWPHIDIGDAWVWGLTLRIIDDLATAAGG